MSSKIILDLCGGTGAWSRPYAENGYEVINVTLPEYDVRAFNPPQNVYGILAAPPCTMFSDARTHAKTPRDLKGGWEIVEACLKIIRHYMFQTKSDQQKLSPLKFWALENPWYGRLKWFLGNPVYTFNPWEFGHNYKKKTGLWGYFNDPIKTHKVIKEVMTEEDLEKSKNNSRKLPKFDYLTMAEIKARDSMAGSKKQLEYWKNTKTRQAMRSITPRGFAEAFFKANQ